MVPSQIHFPCTTTGIPSLPVLFWGPSLRPHRVPPSLPDQLTPSPPTMPFPCRWLLLDTETHDLVAIHTDGNEQISVVSFSPDGAYLAVGSHDNLVYVYTVDQGGRKVSRLGKCSGHSSFITHLDWAQDSSCFVTNSGDYEILYWDPTTCKQITTADAVRNVEWATATCILGFGVFGKFWKGENLAKDRSSKKHP
uniref:EML-like second beta-propeller domain-containing protein n=1 Tax=Sus scrofa TaxID=9823 RepID=A0A8D1N3L4_PIG